MGARQSEFRFEDYDNAELAEAGLLKLHPIGSDAKLLMNRVEGLVGKVKDYPAKCGPITNPRYKDDPKYKYIIYCSYYEAEVIFVTRWDVQIDFAETDNGTKIIRKLKVWSFSEGL